MHAWEALLTMKVDRLENMTKGWFVGDFKPAVLRTDAVEVAVKKYKAGDREEAHYHMKASEITLIVSGKVSMSGRLFSDGEIITISAGEATDFEALTDVTTVVVKMLRSK